MFPDLTLVDERPYGNRYDMVHCVSEPFILLSFFPLHNFSSGLQECMIEGISR